MLRSQSDSDSDVEEEVFFKEYTENSNEEYYDIFERVRKTDKNDIFSKYVGKHRLYVYFWLRLFNPFSKIVLRASSLSNILKYREDKRLIYIFYDPTSKKVSRIKKIIPK
jgi:hypothetical protein